MLVGLVDTSGMVTVVSSVPSDIDYSEPFIGDRSGTQGVDWDYADSGWFPEPDWEWEAIKSGILV